MTLFESFNEMNRLPSDLVSVVVFVREDGGEEDQQEHSSSRHDHHGQSCPVLSHSRVSHSLSILSNSLTERSEIEEN